MRLKSRLPAVFGVALCFGILVHLFLVRRISSHVENVMLPGLSDAWGLDLTTGRVRAGYLPPRARLYELEVGNPPGFPGAPPLASIPRMSVEARFSRADQVITHISGLVVDDAEITIALNSAGKINVASIGEDGAAAGVSVVSALPLVVQVRGEDIALVEDSGGWGRLRVAAQHPDGAEGLDIELTGRIAPLVDTDRPSFDAQGRLVCTNNAYLSVIEGSQDIGFSRAVVEIQVECRDGLYIREHSQLLVNVEGLKLDGELARKAMGMPVPATLRLRVPVSGPFNAPECDWTTALVRAVLGAFSDPTGKAGGGGNDLSSGLEKLIQDASNLLNL